jgi:hypothetical protein
MPAALAVDWNEVKTLALAIGVREAARQMGIGEGAVMQRCKREGWLVQQREQKAAVETIKSEKRVEQGLSATVSNAAEILSKLGKDTKASLSSVAAKAAARLDECDPDELLNPSVADVASKYTGMAAKLHGWDAEGRAGSGQTVVNIAFLAPPAHEDGSHGALIELEGQDSGEQG